MAQGLKALQKLQKLHPMMQCKPGFGNPFGMQHSPGSYVGDEDRIHTINKLHWSSLELYQDHFLQPVFLFTTLASHYLWDLFKKGFQQQFMTKKRLISILNLHKRSARSQKQHITHARSVDFNLPLSSPLL